jgi:hypothetical protein
LNIQFETGQIQKAFIEGIQNSFPMQADEILQAWCHFTRFPFVSIGVSTNVVYKIPLIFTQ